MAVGGGGGGLQITLTNGSFGGTHKRLKITVHPHTPLTVAVEEGGVWGVGATLMCLQGFSSESAFIVNFLSRWPFEMHSVSERATLPPTGS